MEYGKADSVLAERVGSETEADRGSGTRAKFVGDAEVARLGSVQNGPVEMCGSEENSTGSPLEMEREILSNPLD